MKREAPQSESSESGQPLTPEPPASRYPLRRPTFGLSDTVGWDERRVRAELGKPDGREPGRYWLARDGAMPPDFERGDDGSLRRVAVFGPVPCRIEPGQPYEVWVFHNVRGDTWTLYLSRGEHRRNVVVEVASHPTGAVF